MAMLVLGAFGLACVTLCGCYSGSYCRSVGQEALVRLSMLTKIKRGLGLVQLKNEYGVGIPV